MCIGPNKYIWGDTIVKVDALDVIHLENPKTIKSILGRLPSELAIPMRFLYGMSLAVDWATNGMVEQHYIKNDEAFGYALAMILMNQTQRNAAWSALQEMADNTFSVHKHLSYFQYHTLGMGRNLKKLKFVVHRILLEIAKSGWNI